MSEEKAGLYLHVPFCRRVCPYCDFAVRTGNADKRTSFTKHLIAEIALYENHPDEFDTIYFGGGTPSQLEPEHLAAILAAAHRHLRITGDAWIFLEANPEDVTEESAAAWRGMDVRTLSLGVQSFQQENLEFLGREHDANTARNAVETAKSAGFHTVSLDLIYSLPNQTPADWQKDLDAAIDLGVDHVSCYSLTIHDGTRFGLLEKRGNLEQLASDTQADLFRLTHEHLNAHGLQGYEVSNFARSPDHRSRHNQKYWHHTPYLGLGPSAHSFRDRRRSWNHRRSEPWEARIAEGQRPTEGEETLDGRALALEALMLGLRSYRGIDLQEIEGRLGVDLALPNAGAIGRHLAAGHLAHDGARLVPTVEGLAVADSLAAGFKVDLRSSRENSGTGTIRCAIPADPDVEQVRVSCAGGLSNSG